MNCAPPAGTPVPGHLLAAVAGGAAVSVVATPVEIGVDQAAVRSTDPGFVHGGYLVDNYLAIISFLVLAAATALASTGLFSAWYQWLAGLVGVLASLGGISVKVSGFFSPMGGAPSISDVAVLMWVLATTVLWRTPRPTANTQAVAAAATGQAASGSSQVTLLEHS